MSESDVKEVNDLISEIRDFKMPETTISKSDITKLLSKTPKFINDLYLIKNNKELMKDEFIATTIGYIYSAISCIHESLRKT